MSEKSPSRTDSRIIAFECYDFVDPWDTPLSTPLVYPSEKLTAFDGLQAIIGHRFKDVRYLDWAIDPSGPGGILTHQRLEFLGDRALFSGLTQEFVGCAVWVLKESAVRKLIEEFACNKELQCRMEQRKWIHGEPRMLFPIRDSAFKWGDFAEAVIGAALLDGGEKAAQAVIQSLFDAQMIAESVTPKRFSLDQAIFPLPHHISRRRECFDDFVKSADTYSPFIDFRNDFLGVRSCDEFEMRFANYPLLAERMVAAVKKKIPTPSTNQTALALLGQAGFCLRFFARTWDEIGGVEPFDKVRDRYVGICKDGTIMEDLVHHRGIDRIKTGTLAEKVQTYFALAGAALLSDVPEPVDRDAEYVYDRWIEGVIGSSVS